MSEQATIPIASITINGVSFNVMACAKMSYDQFLTHPMHENHFPHLKQADHDKAIAEAYDIIQSQAAQAATVDNGNTNADDRTGADDEQADGNGSSSND